MSSVVIAEEQTTGDAPAEVSQIAQRPENVPEKFWDTEKGALKHEDLLKSYTEAEQKLSQQAADKTTEDATDVEATGVDLVLKNAGLNRQSFTDELNATGELSAQSYESLEKIGFDKATVDQYIAGARFGAMQSQFVEADIKEVKSSVSNFDALSDWAGQNLDDSILDTYDQMIASGNKQQAMAAVAWINGMYADAVGDDVSLYGGDNNGTDASVFRSTAEVTAAMKDARYGKDSAYTNDVARKLGRSNVF